MENQKSTANLRVSQKTREKISELLKQVNDKAFGRKITPAELVDIALARVSKRDISNLQEASLSNTDRLKRDHQQYTSQHGEITFDDYLGKRLSGSLSDHSSKESASADVIEMEQAP